MSTAIFTNVECREGERPREPKLVCEVKRIRARGDARPTAIKLRIAVRGIEFACAPFEFGCFLSPHPSPLPRGEGAPPSVAGNGCTLDLSKRGRCALPKGEGWGEGERASAPSKSRPMLNLMAVTLALPGQRLVNTPCRRRLLGQETLGLEGFVRVGGEPLRQAGQVKGKELFDFGAVERGVRRPRGARVLLQ